MQIWRRLFQSAERAEAFKSIPWGDVTRIEAARVPTTFVVDFRIVLWSGDQQLIEVTENEKGFKAFKAALVKRWPQIEKSLEGAFLGPSNVEEHVTLWKRPDTT